MFARHVNKCSATERERNGCRKDPERRKPGGFAERLSQQRVHLGLTQSDLARKIWGETTDSRGYTVARNRDRISSYELGRAKPERETLDAVAKALGLSVSELAPDMEADRAEMLGQVRGLSMRMLADGTAQLRGDVIVTLATAVNVKVLDLYRLDPVANPENADNAG